MSKHALITGITGQDGSYLAELLLAKGYKVYGLVRRLSQPNYERIQHILDNITLIQGDLLDQSSLERAVEKSQPDEVYNLAAQSHVGTSFEQPVATGEYNGLGVVRLLEAIRLATDGHAKFYQASTSELFGNSKDTYQNEKTPFQPRSPYAVAKLYGHHAVIHYRESYGLHACAGILFNHESPRRGMDFVTRKIARGVAAIKRGEQSVLCLGNLEACRDWGYAPDYVRAMWLMLQQKEPQEFVIATGETHSVREFVDEAFGCVGIHNWHKYVQTDEACMRPADVHFLCGDASKAREQLGWYPSICFGELVWKMVEVEVRTHEIRSNV